jgi:divalent metal cation (Fe/Co/Zn/Cd) transporter
MKIIIPLFIIIAIGLIIYNLTIVNFSNPLEEDSRIALIGIGTAACAIVLMLLLRTSRKIAEKKKY